MKKALLIVAMIMACMVSHAQVNIQEMADFNRGHFTTTLEMFKGDNWGSTFFFNDIYHPNLTTPTGYYTEIARSLNFWQSSKLGALSLHVEWNGGQFASNAWLFGAEYFLHSADFSKRLTLEVMYKEIRGAAANGKTSDIPLQFTAVWGIDNLFGVKGLMFSGFADFWWENMMWGVDENLKPINTSCVFLSEPQLWYNVGQFFNCENLFIGGEVEIAYNFTGGWYSGADFGKNQGFSVAPAAGIKWNF